MDLIAACRVLVEIDDRGSVTRAAAAIGVAQSVASRRILALEKELGATLIERTAQRAVLTPFGRGVVPTARRLVRLAEEFELDAEHARLQPVLIAVPESCSTRDLAVVDAAGRAEGFTVRFVREPPARRVQLATSAAVQMAIVAVPPDEGLWRVRLGAAGRRRRDGVLRLESLRRGRVGATGRDVDPGARLRITPEDDLPHVRDVLNRAGFAAGLVPGQLPVDPSTTSSVAAVLADGDLMLCAEAEAHALGLHWRPIAGLDVARGYAILSESDHHQRLLRRTVADELAAALGADVPEEGDRDQ